MLSSAQLTDFLISFNVTPAAFPGLSQSIPVNSKIHFSDIKNFWFLQGSYTPNNDYLYLLQNQPLNKAPNFLLFICSGQACITMGASQGYMIGAMPIFNNFCLFMPPNSPHPINGIYLEGRPGNSLMPMPQGVALDYICIMGQAVLS